MTTQDVARRTATAMTVRQAAELDVRGVRVLGVRTAVFRPSGAVGVIGGLSTLVGAGITAAHHLL